MKKLVLTMIFAVMGLMNLSAQETIKALYNGNPVDVTWDNSLKIEASNFENGVNVGDYIYITFTKTSDVIELKANGTWLPGSKFTYLGEDTRDIRTYITSNMLAKLKEYGLELCGASFTVSEVSICNDGFKMPDDAIWGGYFWVENWNTLELFKTAFDNYAGQRYMEIYLSDDNGDNTNYFMKVLTAWDNPDAVWDDNSEIAHETRKAIVDLKGIDVKSKLADVNTLMVQSNPEGGASYNITAIVLRNEDGTADIGSIINGTDNLCNIYNLQGMLLRKNVSMNNGTYGLPTGIYIINGKKHI